MYQKEDVNIKSGVDWLTVALYLVLMFCGWVSIYGASYQYDNAISIFDTSGRAGSQLVWIGTSIILCFILLKLDSSLFDVFSYYIYIAFMALLVLTIFIAPEVKGSRSWIEITSSIRIQPAEFAKFAAALALAKYLSTYNLKLLKPKSLLTVFGIISLPIILILLQQETGSALVFTAFILVLYRVGLPGLVLVLGATLVVLFVVTLKYSNIDIGIISMGELISIIVIITVGAILLAYYTKDFPSVRNLLTGVISIFLISYLLHVVDIDINWGIVAFISLAFFIIYLIYLTAKKWSQTYILIGVFALSSIAFVGSVNYLFSNVMQPHQQMRIKVSLGMEEDLKGAGYNVNQSKIAIGSGGFMGKGFLNGTQTKLKYVPEQDTDFIFCTVGEEQGFVGSVAVLFLFLILILRLIYLAERQKNTFGLVYGYCVACIFFFHLTINIGMVIGLTPVIGIPLPFFSYGGSSLWTFSILLFIFLRIDMSRKRR